MEHGYSDLSPAVNLENCFPSRSLRARTRFSAPGFDTEQCPLSAKQLCGSPCFVSPWFDSGSAQLRAKMASVGACMDFGPEMNER